MEILVAGETIHFLQKVRNIGAIFDIVIFVLTIVLPISANHCFPLFEISATSGTEVLYTDHH